MRRLLLVALMAGCTAPPVLVSAPELDATATDAADDGYFQADGRHCSGSDEDGDGIPNGCDNCFNIPNVQQEAASPEIGSACEPGFHFEAAIKREAPETFESLDLQYNFLTIGLGGSGKLAPAPSTHPDHVTGGNFDDSFNMMASFGTLGSRTMVFTAVASHNVTAGTTKYGLLARAAVTPTSFLTCYATSDGKFAVGRASGDCSLPEASHCTVAPISELTAMPAVVLGYDKHGIRMSMAIGDLKTLIECRVFSIRDRTTLFLPNVGKTMWRVEAEIDNADLPPADHIGYFVQGGQASFYSADLLTQ